MTKTPKNTQKIVHQDDKALAALGYIWILFVIPFLLKQDSKFVRHHSKQGLVLFIFELLVILVGTLPILGWFVITPLGTLTAILLAVLGISNALQGNMWEMPLLGRYAKRLNI